MALERSCGPPDQPCVLVIDDDADLVAFLFSVLIDEGFSIVAASDGQQAFDLLEHGLRPHLILLDLRLPRLSGFDLLSHLHADPLLKNIPRIVITGEAERPSVVADAVFEKPFDHQELLVTIRRLIGAIPLKAAGGTSSQPTMRDVAHERSRPERRRTPRRRSDHVAS